MAISPGQFLLEYRCLQQTVVQRQDQGLLGCAFTSLEFDLLLFQILYFLQLLLQFLAYYISKLLQKLVFMLLFNHLREKWQSLVVLDSIYQTGHWGYRIRAYFVSHAILLLLLEVLFDFVLFNFHFEKFDVLKFQLFRLGVRWFIWGAVHQVMLELSSLIFFQWFWAQCSTPLTVRDCIFLVVDWLEVWIRLRPLDFGTIASSQRIMENTQLIDLIQAELVDASRLMGFTSDSSTVGLHVYFIWFEVSGANDLISISDHARFSLGCFHILIPVFALNHRSLPDIMILPSEPSSRMCSSCSWRFILRLRSNGVHNWYIWYLICALLDIVYVVPLVVVTAWAWDVAFRVCVWVYSGSIIIHHLLIKFRHIIAPTQRSISIHEEACVAVDIIVLHQVEFVLLMFQIFNFIVRIMLQRRCHVIQSYALQLMIGRW